jgi:hypothetical protein
VLELGLGKPDAGRLADAGPLIDTGVPMDPGSAGDYWSLEPKQGGLEVRGAFYSGSTAYVRVVTSLHHACEHGAPVDVSITEDGVIVVQPFVWLHHIAPEGTEPCFYVTDQVSRDVPLPDVPPGRYRIEEPLSKAYVFVSILEAPACGPPSVECNSDCDCTFGVECVAPSGPNQLGRCGIPCTPVVTGCCGQVHPHADLECPPEMFCGDLGLATGICKQHAADPCLSDDECPIGMRCPVTDIPRGCIWDVALNSRVRHACIDSSECDPGLVCVDRGSRRTCEIPCFTNRMACPIMHACSSDAGWICEWLGE